MKERAEKINWKQYTSLSFFPEYLRAEYIIYDAFKQKIINWNVYNLACKKIARVKNGSWMFEIPDVTKN